MIYPKSLKENDIIGVTAPSAGLTRENDDLKIENAEKNIKKLGFRYLETDNVRKGENGRSAKANIRAEEFMKLWENPELDLNKRTL